ncbi:MAG: mandelate racemase/muconate lactonizing enzyme family protein [Candidatus Limnocylindria bacterium]
MTTTAEHPIEQRGSFDRGSLRIERIETIALRAPLARRFAGSGYWMDNRCTVVTRISTSDGITSQTYTGDTDDEQPILVRIIHDEMAPRLMGLSATDPEACWQAMEPSTNNVLRDRGLALQAIACLDVAIWDLFGKALGLPIHRVWGAHADALPISIIGGYYHLSLAEIEQAIGGYADAGFAGCKFKIGGRTPHEDAERVRVAHGAAAGRLALMVDANQGYSLSQAVEFARLVADLDPAIRWFEEPCRWTNDRRWMRDVRFISGIPICAGQSETTLSGFRDLLVEGAIDVSNFDASWSGGPTVWRKAAALAEAFGVEMGHHEEPQVSAALLASVRDATFVECFDEERDPFFWHLLASRGSIVDGRYRVPTGPGFGIELESEFVERYAVDRRVSG